MDEFLNRDSGVGYASPDAVQLLQNMLATSPEAAKAMALASAESAIATGAAQAEYGATLEQSLQSKILAAQALATGTTNANVELRNNLLANQQRTAEASGILVNAEAATAAANTAILNQQAALSQKLIANMGGVEALDSLGIKLAKAQELVRQKEEALQAARATSNPLINDMMDMLGMKSTVTVAQEELANAQESDKLYANQRTELLSAMQNSNSFIVSLGNNLNSATVAAQADKLKADADRASATVAQNLATADATLAIRLQSMRISDLSAAAAYSNTMSDAEAALAREKFTFANNQAQSTYKQTLDIIKVKQAEERAKGNKLQVVSSLGKLDTKLGMLNEQATKAVNNKATPEEIQALEEQLAKRQAAITTVFSTLGISSPASVDRKFTDEIAYMVDAVEAGKSIYSGMQTVTRMADIVSAMPNSKAVPSGFYLLQDLVNTERLKINDKAPDKAPTAQVEQAVRATITHELRNPFSPQNKLINFHVNVLSTLAENSPTSELAASDFTKFVLNRKGTVNNSMLDMNDIADYITRGYSQQKDYGTSYELVKQHRARYELDRQQRANEVLGVLNGLYQYNISNLGLDISPMADKIPTVPTVVIDGKLVKLDNVNNLHRAIINTTSYSRGSGFMYRLTQTNP